MLNYLFAFAFIFILAVSCQQESKEIDKKTVQLAQKLIDFNFTEQEIDSMLQSLAYARDDYKKLREIEIPNKITPRLNFDPRPQGFVLDEPQAENKWEIPGDIEMPINIEDVAFYTISELSSLLKKGKLTSTQLTQMYINRLKKYGDTLQCVVTLTEERALKQAAKADEEMAKGIYRGPLHGIPFGVKDLFAVEGYKTTWGAMPYKDQQIEQTATVVKKLEDAGAVLVAKLTLGALAMGDVWFGGVTKNPWDLNQGSSGSSAGSASATAAGLVAFAIGTETWGSIVSPSTRCGVTGLRPTFGRVSRSGAMALSWSMDKVGPICRNAQDCALVFDVIRGKDANDPSTTNYPFNYNNSIKIKDLKIGYLKDLFEGDDYRSKENDLKTLEELKKMGATLQEVKLPVDLPIGSMAIILEAEAAAAFDELTRNNKDDEMVAQHEYAWPNIFRKSRFIPAVEYIQASRMRDLLIEELNKIVMKYDVIICPSFGGDQLLMTNLTGHPCVVVPNGFDTEKHPTSISFIGNLYDEATILQVAYQYQQVTKFYKTKPENFNTSKN
mgnify:CR=1 FL=1